MTKCQKCGSVIPDGKHYCGSCWSIVSAEYQSRKQDYDNRSAEWNSLDSSIKEARHRGAEKAVLGTYTFAPFLIVDIVWIIIGFSANLLSNIKFWAIAVIIFVVGIIVKKYLSKYVGRVFRGIFKAFISGGIGAIIGGILGYFYKDPKTINSFQELLTFLHISYHVKSNSMVFAIILASILIVISIIYEITGRHHASAAPVAPSEPTP